MNKTLIAAVVVVIVAGTAVFYARWQPAPPADRIVVSGNIEVTEAQASFKIGHAVVDDPALVGPIRQRLEDTHYQVDRVEPIVPSLEDVFVSLIEARDRRDRAASVVGS